MTDDAFIGEIRAFAFGYVPQGWLECNGLTYSVSQYTALYSIVGNYFGGNPGTSFGVPNLQGLVINGQGQIPGGGTYQYNKTGGVDQVTLTLQTMPAHSHPATGGIAPGNVFNVATDTPGTGVVISNLGAVVSSGNKTGKAYDASNPSTDVLMGSQMISPVGGGAPHNNQAPYLPMIFGICAEGIYPPRP